LITHDVNIGVFSIISDYAALKTIEASKFVAYYTSQLFYSAITLFINREVTKLPLEMMVLKKKKKLVGVQGK
jgi:hypothetical protein